ncbi:EAL domain-containing protein, partial [Salmonella enterica subsp. enterica serovar Mbandaka]|nr:EAL domain-containing protein [Salmonella enterica subsp. enterica serovar Mbandaka]
PDILKIDKSFTAAIGTDAVNSTVTDIIIALGQRLNIELVAEGFGFHIPKGYLYAAIGFSIVIEVFNQIARRNFIRHQST